METKLKKIGNVIANVLLCFAIFCAVSLAITNVTSGRPSVLGYRVLFVVSASMEPTIMTDQPILAKTIDAEDIEIGDIIAYERMDGPFKKIIVHRVIEIYEENDMTYYIFKGDNNDEQDKDPVVAEQIMYEIIAY